MTGSSSRNKQLACSNRKTRKCALEGDHGKSEEYWSLCVDPGLFKHNQHVSINSLLTRVTQAGLQYIAKLTGSMAEVTFRTRVSKGLKVGVSWNHVTSRD